MTELVVKRIAVELNYVPRGWAEKVLFDELERGVAHAIADGKDEFTLKNKDGVRFWFGMKDEPLEFKSESHQGVAEIDVFTLTAMTRHYVSITAAK